MSQKNSQLENTSWLFFLLSGRIAYLACKDASVFVITEASDIILLFYHFLPGG